MHSLFCGQRDALLVVDAIEVGGDPVLPDAQRTVLLVELALAPLQPVPQLPCPIQPALEGLDVRRQRAQPVVGGEDGAARLLKLADACLLAGDVDVVPPHRLHCLVRAAAVVEIPTRVVDFATKPVQVT